LLFYCSITLDQLLAFLLLFALELPKNCCATATTFLTTLRISFSLGFLSSHMYLVHCYRTRTLRVDDFRLSPMNYCNLACTFSVGLLLPCCNATCTCCNQGLLCCVQCIAASNAHVNALLHPLLRAMHCCMAICTCCIQGLHCCIKSNARTLSSFKVCFAAFKLNARTLSSFALSALEVCVTALGASHALLISSLCTLCSQGLCCCN
jgi:hypothetical protein